MMCERNGEEARLLSRLANGDPAVRTELFRKYNGVMRRRANQLLRDSEAADDAVQDAWLTVFAHRRDFSGRSGLITWIVAITKNCARNRLRRERRFVPLAALDAIDDDPTPHAVGRVRAPLPTDEVTPEILVLRREVLRQLKTALEALPESLRSVVLLRDVAGASSEEACRRLAIQDGAQRTRLHRGRARLRRALRASLSVP